MVCCKNWSFTVVKRYKYKFKLMESTVLLKLSVCNVHSVIVFPDFSPVKETVLVILILDFLPVKETVLVILILDFLPVKETVLVILILDFLPVKETICSCFLY